MALGELIYGTDTLNQGRIKINNFYSGTTNIWSGSFGTYSVIRNNSNGTLGNTAFGQNSIAAGYRNRTYSNFSMAFWGSGNTATTLFSSIVAGRNNTITGQGSHIVGGALNTITNSQYSFIGGGVGNTATTFYNAITIAGGSYNYASGNRSSIAGGARNFVSGHFSFAAGSANTVSGSYSSALGRGNLASGLNSVVSGGFYNSATGTSSTIAGGSSNLSFASNSFVGGGNANKASGTYSSVVGGRSNSATTSLSSVVGGRLNILSGSSTYSFIGGGHQNTITTTLGSIVGGYKNSVRNNMGFVGGGRLNRLISGSDGSAIIGGSANTINYGFFSAMAGGRDNTISNNTHYSFIGGGQLNSIAAFSLYSNDGRGTAIIGGRNNYTNVKFGAIIAGRSNRVQGAYTNYCSVVLGGRNNLAYHNYAVAMGGGSMTRGNCQLVIGNQPTLAASQSNNRIRLDAIAGQGVASVSFITGTADYAEFFEWLDKNLNNENRLGYFVSLVGDKITIGNSNIIGIVSSAPGFIGDAAELAWNDMYIKDEWNRETMETYKTYSWNKNGEPMTVFEDANGRKMIQYPNPGHPTGLDFDGIIPTTGVRTGSTISPKMNPNYDPNSKYTPRSERKEWAPVGLLGKLHVRTAEPITGNKISVNEQGLAINGDKYDVLSVIREHSNNQYGIVKVFFK